MRAATGLLFLMGMASPLDQAPRELTFAKARLTLPPGATVGHHRGARGRFGGTFIDIDPRMTVEVARLGVAEGSLREFVDSAVTGRNGQLNSRWPRLVALDTVAGTRRVVVLHPACGDCEDTEVYLDVAGERLVATWGVDGLGGRTVDQRNSSGWQVVAGFH